MKKLLIAPSLFLVLSSPVWAYGHSTAGSFSHMLQSALIHGLVYGVVFKVMHQLGLIPSIALAAVGLIGVWLWTRRSDTRGR